MVNNHVISEGDDLLFIEGRSPDFVGCLRNSTFKGLCYGSFFQDGNSLLNLTGSHHGSVADNFQKNELERTNFFCLNR